MDNIHPNLKKEAFIIRFGLPIFIFTTILPIIVVIVVLQSTMQFDFIRMTLLFFGVLILSILSVLVYIKVFSKYRHKVQRASTLLYQAKPEKGIIDPAVLYTVQGPVFRIVHNEANTFDLIALKIEKKGIKKMHSLPVEVYKDSKGIHDTVVVKARNSYLIGKLRNKMKAGDVINEYKKAKRMMVASVPLSILVLVIVQIFHISRIKDRAEFAEKTNSWPTTSGRIISSQVNEIRIKEGKTHTTGYVASIRYIYNLSSREYQSTNIHLAYEPTKKYNDALNYVSKYPLGSTVSVHYNPKDYTFALLEAGHQEDILKEIGKVYIVTFAISAILIFITVIIIVVFKQQEKKAVEFFKAG